MWKGAKLVREETICTKITKKKNDTSIMLYDLNNSQDFPDKGKKTVNQKRKNKREEQNYEE